MTRPIPILMLHDAWHELEPLLRPAMALAPASPGVLARLVSGDAVLWGIYECGKPIAAAVTGLLFEPKRGLIWMVGGTRIKEWMHDFMDTIVAWARALGCVSLRAETPRRGWKHIAMELGFEPRDPINGFLSWERPL